MEKDTGRVEAFSDGVFAIAITLLILEVRVPETGHGTTNPELFGMLLDLWPSYFALLFSFFVILVMWMNHHEFLRWVRTAADYRFLFANGFVLLMVTFVPFPTTVIARYLSTAAASAAAAFYCGTFFFVSLAGALFRSVTRKRRLLHDHVSEEAVARVRRAYNIGPIVYAISTALALWNAVVGLLVCASLWVLWTRLCYDVRRERAV
ncbi:MAG: DUF1211 domain-containing protein [Planctomycetes bacterium]|nr:DUF1211 domain-containing protein [Planctomycetota bacterium]